MDIKMNSYQTPLTEDLKQKYPKEVWDDVLEYISQVKFLQNLIAPEEERGFIEDRPIMQYEDDDGNLVDYEDGRKKIDITNPHILKDMDFFRERAIFFEKNGRYTHIIPNGNPKSEYAQFWKAELKKWKYGLVRPDGEWIPGELYFYWNYVQIPLTEKDKNTKSKKTSERVRKFPKPWLGDYLFHHYINAAKDEGMHGKLLKTRGVGFSLKTASWSPRNMYVLPGSQNPNFHLASEKTFLSGDKGIWGKILDNLDFIAAHTPFPRMRLQDGKKAMELQLGYEDEFGGRKGLLSSVFGISLKDNPDKARGIRGPLIHYEEDGLFPNLEKAWNVNRKAVEDGSIASGFMLAGGCLTENNYVWNNKGELVKINQVTRDSGIIGYDGENSYKEKIGWFKEPEEKECVRITTSGGDYIECSIDHPILWSKNHWRKKSKGYYIGKFCTFKNAGDIKVGDQILKIDNLDVFGDKTIKDARLYGLMVGDGNLSKNASPSLSCDSDDIYSFIKENYNYTVSKEFKTKKSNIYRQLGLSRNGDIFKNSTIDNLVDLDKRFPLNINKYDKKSLAEFIGGYYDADGNVYYNKKRNIIRIVLTSKSERLLQEMKNQLIKFGIHSNISKEFRKTGYKPNTNIYRLYITSYNDVKRFKDNIKLLSNHKQKTLNKIDDIKWIDRTRENKYFFRLGENKQGQYFVNRNLPLTNTRHENVTKVEFIGKQIVYNLHTTHTNTYLANNFITKQTGGVEGASFEGSEKLFYKPRAYNIYGIPNVFDRNTDGSTECGFFWGAYLNRNKCYDEDSGEPDIIKALLEICNDRFEVKYSSSDANAITQKKAEEPITPQEAVMRTEGTVFPVADLKEYLEQISVKRDNFVAEHMVGDLVYDVNGDLVWRPNSDIHPLRSYDLASGDKTGALEIFEMPKKNFNGEIPWGRYIAGIDPIDADTGESLFSILIMDTFVDRIVAEYSGRPRTANEAYEMALRTLKFYNAEANYEKNLKGLFSYFDSKNALHYLADNPQILKDMNLIKATNQYGNNAKGTHANAQINSWGRLLQADWQRSKAYGDEDDHRLNLHRLRGLAYIEECIKWNSDGNFDRVSAGIMLFILREDKVKRTNAIKDRQGERVKKLSNDAFFTKNYNNNKNIQKTIYSDEE